MKINKLVLEGFGHFTDQEFDFRGGANFHVVYGLNEAGKSTVLHGLRDALFGIDARSPYNFVHDYGDMRLLAEIERAGGASIVFRRRKGNKNTLISLADQVLSDTALAGFLGPIDKEFFTRMFGLDHAELRRGGQALLESGGEAADSLFGAASGLSSVLSVSSRLKETADGLFTSRKSQSKPLYQALDRRREAQRELRESTVTANEWKKLEEETERVNERREQLETETKVQRAKETRANRSLHVRPLIKKIRKLRQEIFELGKIPSLAPDSSKRCEKALTNKREASSELDRLDNAISRVNSHIGELAISNDLLAHKDTIDALQERRGRIVAGREDKPKLDTALLQEVTKISRSLRNLGLDKELSEAKTAIPLEGSVARIRNLVAEEAEKRAQAVSTKKAVQRTEQLIKRTEQVLSGLPERRDYGKLQKALQAVQRKGDLTGQLKATQQRVEHLAQQLANANAALPSWDGKPQELVALKAPVSDTVSKFDSELAGLNEKLSRVNERIKETENTITSLDQEIQYLLAAGDIPTQDAVQSARDYRDEGWRLIRGRYFEKSNEVADTHIKSFSADLPIADVYEGAVKKADLLVDRKEAEAQRVASLEELIRRKQGIEESLVAFRGQQLKTENQYSEKQQAWAKVWEPAGITPLSPREMASWLVERDRAKGIYEQWKLADFAHESLKTGYEAARESLQSVLSGLDEEGRDRIGDDLDSLLIHAEDLLENLLANENQRNTETDRLREQAAELGEHQEALDDATAALELLQKEWKDAMKVLGQPETQRPQDIGSVLDQYDRLEATITESDRLKGRVNGINKDEAAFREQVLGLIQSLAPDIKQDDAVGACQLLFKRLQEMINAQGQLERLQSELADFEEQKENQAAIVANEEDTLVQLRKEARCVSDEELIATHRRWARHQDLQRSLKGWADALEEAGDGLSFEVLAEEADISSPDDDRATIQATEAQLKIIRGSFTQIGHRIRHLEQQREEIEQGRGADRYAQAIEQSLADLRDVSQAYIVQKTAHLLLQIAVERVRQNRQGPILDAAGSLFSDLTKGSFSSLEIEFDEHDRPILKGERHGGIRVDVDGMSEGARDQLFLALRLALVKEYLAEAEPLPFVADDLLVSFDDERAGVALRVLRDLSATTQILFFTHHAHLVELAREYLGNDGFTLHTF